MAWVTIEGLDEGESSYQVRAEDIVALVAQLYQGQELYEVWLRTLPTEMITVTKAHYDSLVSLTSAMQEAL